MRGTILEFDAQTHRGSVAGYDGNTYEFVMLDWRASAPPVRGALVDFGVEANSAIEITPVASPQSRTQPWLNFLYSAEGRTSRRDYWMRYAVPLIAISIGASIIDGILFAEADGKLPAAGLRNFVYLFFLVPMVAVPAKRLHDLGYSGWWAGFSSLLGPTVILAVAAYWYYSTQMRIPDGAVSTPVEPWNPVVVAALIVGISAVMFWWLHLAISVMCLRGQAGENKYGPDPLPPLANPPPANRGTLTSLSVSGLAVLIGGLASLVSVLREPAPATRTVVGSEFRAPVAATPVVAASETAIRQKTEAGIREMMEFPLIGLLVREVPAARDDLEAAASEYARAPNQAEAERALERARQVIASLRDTYVPPALKHAPDIDIVRIWQAQGALVEHLLQTNVKACREYAEVGVRDLASLDRQGRDLFTQGLKATEVAFMSGRISHIEYPVYGADELTTLFVIVGFTESDFDVFTDTSGRTDLEVCEVTNKMYGGALQLPDDMAAQFMRTILASQ